jgi:hypothetical protein
MCVRWAKSIPAFVNLDMNDQVRHFIFIELVSFRGFSTMIFFVPQKIKKNSIHTTSNPKKIKKNNFLSGGSPKNHPMKKSTFSNRLLMLIF